MEKQKVDKYLTDMKELPPKYAEVKTEVKKPVVKKPELPKPVVENAFNGPKNNTIVLETKTKNIETNLSIFSVKDIILGVINFITIIFLIYLLTKLPQKSKELQAEKIIEVRTQGNSSQQNPGLQSDIEKAKKLESLFLDQSGIVNFVGDVEKLKTGNSSIQKVTFASQTAVKDKSEIYGIPVVIELIGSWQSIGPDLEKIQALPYLFRPVNIEAGPTKDDPSVILFNYGGILYVNDKEIAK